MRAQFACAVCSVRAQLAYAVCVRCVRAQRACSACVRACVRRKERGLSQKGPAYFGNKERSQQFNSEYGVSVTCTTLRSRTQDDKR